MQCMAHINENGKHRMAFTRNMGNVTEAANGIIADENIREGAEVLIAYTSFDYPSQRFVAEEHRFTVEDGRAKDLAKA